MKCNKVIVSYKDGIREILSDAYEIQEYLKSHTPFFLVRTTDSLTYIFTETIRSITVYVDKETEE